MSFSRIHLSKSAIEHNIKVITNLARTKKIIFPVKANAYGHGLYEIVKMSSKLIDCFMTATLEEAEKVRSVDPSKDVFIDLPLIDIDEIEWAVEKGFIINIATLDQLSLLENLSYEMRRKIRVQVEFDTGMNRTGFKYTDIEEVNDFFLKHPEIKVGGVFTHYAAGINNKDYLIVQYELFKKIISKLKFPYSFVHSENSAALLTSNFTDMDYIRPGITLYGLKPSSLYSVPLKPVLSWKSVVVDVKVVNRGEGISYGPNFRAKKDMKVATIPVGYGNGYPRILSEKGYVIIRGKRVKIIGIICMNHFMVDVSEVSGISVGEEVTIIGKSGDAEITVDEIASLAGTINYEITTRISPFIPRIIEK